MTAHVRNLRPALVLNADYQPLSYHPLSLWTWEDAVKAIFLDRVDVVRNYDEMIHSPTLTMPLPAVIALRQYHRTPQYAAFTRMNVRLRDRHRCIYCADRGPELNFDHVVPRSRGGPSTFENVALSCIPCNQRKGNRTPAEAGMTLSHEPYRPTTRELMAIGREFPPPFVVEEFKDYTYWSVPLS